MTTWNFSGGPGALPESVIRQTQEAIGFVPEAGLPLLGISHRSDWFAAVLAEAEANIRALLALPADYHVLFLQGGATLQFSMIPMLMLRGRAQTAEYLRTGYWSSKSIPEAAREGNVDVLWDGAHCGYRCLPRDSELHYAPDAAYLHYVSNETVEGLQFHWLPGRDDVPRVCDMSSDFLSGPCDATRFAAIYAHAQKNLGPAGVTVTILRDALLGDAPDDLHSFLDYRRHVGARSIYNTPPVFAIYVVLLVTRWLLQDVGGLARMGEINRAKAERLYRLIDDSDGFYVGHADPVDRSLMNVVFKLNTREREAAFLQQARAAGFHGLPGHRSLGGIRASIYNAVTMEAVDALCEFMEDFRRTP
jgi:phosphoserine aminotransferase